MDAELQPEDLERIEDALRAELASAGAAAPAFRPELALARAAAADPLDEFFWREDERAPALPRLTALAAAPASPAIEESREEWLTFSLGAEEYALEVGQVREILKAPAITEVPRSPAHVLGIIMVRGEVVTVFDPRRRLGLPPVAPGRLSRVLVCAVAGEPCGLLVDGVSQVVRLAASAIERRPGVGASASGAVLALGRDRGRLFIQLDLDAVLRDGAAGEEA
ncbi:chemotaxis protein CheW [Anaeromyxobacter diazotrophicus]|uniref:CheW-like domain-containing protein n=1 Tax=Anaeromyxobacter diazotrophicus TaxID=2590199 RepID=A0A7I9VIE3_9BACT|nr:chemotaxis protein CheW [Anaeromyxobacter diazotrophicus]GEJ56182.1 hypothetical protein AMYX_09230 [Anaeromyxobacter diazotrophicus]